MTTPAWRTKLLLLWMAGISLRLTVLAVPPLLAQIHTHLRLTETEVGSLTGLPVLLLAIAAVPGSLLVARLGARRALMIGLAVIGAAGAARALGPLLPMLFLMTFFMGCGVAVSQPCLPALVRGWLPDSVGLATATFANGLLIGEILPVAITASVIVPVLGGWQSSLAFWSIPVIITGLAILILTHNEAPGTGAAPARWWPDWKDSTTWILGLTLGGAAASYWGANAFIPDFLRIHHHSAFITPALTALNVVQLPASFAVATLPRRLVARSWPLSLAGGITVASTVGILFLPPVWFVASAGVLGFSTALVFVLTLALPPLLAEPGDTHRISAAVFTISYTCPFLGSLLGGALWDGTGVAQLAFVPLLVGGAMVLSLPTRLDFGGARRVLGGGLLVEPEVI